MRQLIVKLASELGLTGKSMLELLAADIICYTDLAEYVRRRASLLYLEKDHEWRLLTDQTEIQSKMEELVVGAKTDSNKTLTYAGRDMDRVHVSKERISEVLEEKQFLPEEVQDIFRHGLRNIYEVIHHNITNDDYKQTVDLSLESIEHLRLIILEYDTVLNAGGIEWHIEYGERVIKTISMMTETSPTQGEDIKDWLERVSLEEEPRKSLEKVVGYSNDIIDFILANKIRNKDELKQKLYQRLDESIGLEENIHSISLRELIEMFEYHIVVPRVAHRYLTQAGLDCLKNIAIDTDNERVMITLKDIIIEK